jgi:predicted ATP-grasp superfamily ATP-dependent carboligase
MPSPWLDSLSPEVLVIALSARSLALAASRAGYRPFVVDLFGDTDTRRLAAASTTVPGDLGQGFEAAALIAAAERLAPAGHDSCGLVYGSGLEAAPDLLEALSRGRRLWGNTPAVLKDIKDPVAFFSLLDRLGLPHPELATTPPQAPEDWLVKRVGASGGSHVRPLATGDDAAAGCYFQRRIAGRPVSALFAANRRDASLLGWSEQWALPDAGQPFRFGGAVQPAIIDAGIISQVEAALPQLAAATGLVGLNSIDMMVAEDGSFGVLEINPRPGASLDVFDGEGESALFRLHVACCEGRPLPYWRPPVRATAMTVVYADRPLNVPASVDWPDWLADRPAPGAHIHPSAPVCTVMAEAAGAAEARRLAMDRNLGVLAALASGDMTLLRDPEAWSKSKAIAGAG